jgi:hypothetical protein
MNVISRLLSPRLGCVSLMLLGSVVVTSPAVADVPDPGGASASVCAGQSVSHVVRRYVGIAWGNSTVPLRCGQWSTAAQRGWGYRKLVAKGRWNPWWDGMIGATMQSPASVTTVGSSTTFKSRWFTQCVPIFRFVVVVESRPTPQGVVTGVNNAYQKFLPTSRLR